MGADELFGGYRRHRTALNLEGWNGLRNELQLDLSRISTRNLGRDNRIVSDHCCQGRLPYLDESVVSYVSSLEPWERYSSLFLFVVKFCYSDTKTSIS
jgi:asparagine synthetase B (glutamine-hydrolysing)